MRKICIFASHSLPYLGGIERYTSNLAKALMEMGDEVLIVTCNDMKLKEYELVDQVPVLRLPCFNFMGGRYPVTKWNKEFRKSYQKLKERDFDLVLINARFYPHTLLGAWYARRKGIRCVILDHGTSHMTVGKKLPDLVFAAVEHMLTFGDKLLCREYFGVSRACCHWLKHFGIHAKGVLYNAVDAQEIRRIGENPVKDFRKEYQIAPDTALIVYTGRLIKEKGIFKLIEAVKKLDPSWNVCLLIAGDGEEMGHVRACECERVKALGRLDFQEIASLLCQTEIYCLPTEYPEGFPTSVLEAAAAGCYVITTDRGGSRELIQDDSWGKILTEVSAETIRDAIEKALADPSMRRAAAQKAQQRVNEIYTWKKTAEKVDRLAARGTGK